VQIGVQKIVAHYLDFHRDTWRVRVVVPERLRAKIGQRTLTWETGTDDFDRARRRAAPVIRNFLKKIADVDGRRPASRFLRDSRSETRSSEWYTPRAIFESMPGVAFDMDVASPIGGAAVVPWIPTRRHLTQEDDGLAVPWEGFIWMNPPFGLRHGLRDWLTRFVAHADGVALLPATSYARWWHDICDRSDATLFVKGYVTFVSPRGPLTTRASFGSSMFAIGERGVAALRLAAQNRLGTIIERSQHDLVGTSGLHRMDRFLAPLSEEARAGSSAV
jgi:hypothetical protein